MVYGISRSQSKEYFSLVAEDMNCNYKNFLIVGKVTVPILGKGPFLRPISTSLGLALVRGDFEPDNRILVYLDGSYSLGPLRVTFNDCNILVSSTKNHVEDSLEKASEFLLIMQEGSFFEVQDSSYPDENWIICITNHEVKSMRRSDKD